MIDSHTLLQPNVGSGSRQPRISWGTEPSRQAFFVAALLFVCVSGRTTLAQSDADPAFTARARRLQQAVYRNPRLGATWQRWWDSYAERGRTDDLVELAREMTANKPSDAKAALVWGLVCEQQRQWRDAANAYASVNELSPEDIVGLSRHGAVLVRLREWHPAAKLFQQALDREPPERDRLVIAKQLARCYDEMEQDDQAIRMWVELSAKPSRDPRVSQQIAERLQTLGANEHAIQVWQRVGSQTRDPELRFNAAQQIASLQMRGGNVDAAVDGFARLMNQVDPASWRAAELRLQLDQALEKSQGINAVVRFWETFQQQHPSRLPTLIHLATVLGRAGQLERSLETYQEAVRKAPGNEAAILGVIDGLWRQGQMNEAIERMTRYATARPDDVDRWLRLADMQLLRPDVTEEVAQREAIRTWQSIADRRAGESAFELTLAQRIERSALQEFPNEQRELNRPYPAFVLQKKRLLLEAAEAFYQSATDTEEAIMARHAHAEFLHRIGKSAAALRTWKHDLPSQQQLSDLASQRKSNRSTEARIVEVCQRFLDTARRMHGCGYVSEAVSVLQLLVDQDIAIDSVWVKFIDWQLESGELTSALSSAQRMRDRAGSSWSAQRDAIERVVEAAVAAGQLDRMLRQRRLNSPQVDEPSDEATTQEALVEQWLCGLLCDAAKEYDRAVAFYQMLAEATEFSDASRQTAANDPVVIRRLAHSLVKSERPEEAIEQLTRLTKMNTARDEADFRQLAELQLARKQRTPLTKTLSAWSRAFRSDPEPHLFAASVAVQENDVISQQRHLERALRVAPQDVQARRLLADCLRRDGKQRQAQQHVLTALEHTASYAEKLSLVRWSLTWTDDSDSRDWLLRQIDLRGAQSGNDSTDARIAVALCVDMDRRTEAIERLKTLQQRVPRDEGVISQLVQLSLESGDLQLAIQGQRKLVDLGGRSSDKELLARLLRRSGQLKDATEIWDSILEQSPPAAEAIELVADLVRNGRLFRAQQLAEAALSRSPDNRQLAYQTALIHLALGQRLEAFQAFQQLLVETDVCVVWGDRGDTTQQDALRASLRRLIGAMASSISVNAIFSDCESKRLLLGAKHERTVESYFRPELFSFSNRATPASESNVGDRSSESIALRAAIVWLRLAKSYVHDHPWSPSASLDRLNPSQLRTVLLAAWATADHRTAVGVRSHLTDVSPADRWSDWTSWLTAPVPDESPEGYVRRIGSAYSRSVADLESETWNRIHLAMLALSQDDRLLIDPLSNRIEASSINELSLIAQLALRFDGPLRRKLSGPFIARVVQVYGEVDTESVADPRATASLLSTVLDWQDVSVEQRLPILQRWLPAYVRSSATQKLSTTQRSRPVSVDEDRVRGLNASIIVAAEAARRRRPPQSGAFPLARAIVKDADTGGSWSQLFGLQQALSAQWFQRGSRSAVKAISPANETWDAADFPHPSEFITPAAIQLLRRSAELLVETSEREKLLSAFGRRESPPRDEKEERQEIAARMSKIILLWFWDLRQEALQEMDRLAKESGRRPVQLDRMRMLLASNKLGEAQKRIRDLVAADSASSSVLLLKRALYDAWRNELQLGELKAHQGAVLAMVPIVSRNQLVSAGVDGVVRIWDVAINDSSNPESNAVTSRLKYQCSGHDDIITCLAISSDGHWLASGGYDRAIRIWNVETGQLKERLGPLDATVRSIGFSPSGKMLAGGLDDGSLQVWDLAGDAKTLNLAHRWSAEPNGFKQLRFEGENRVWTFGGNDTISLWDRRNQTQLGLIHVGGELHSADWTRSSSGQVRFVVSAKRKLHWITTAETPSEGRRLDVTAAESREELGTTARVVKLSHDREQVYVGRDDDLVQILDRSQGIEVAGMSGHRGRVLSIAVTPHWFATAGLGGTIKIWRADSSDELSADAR